MKECAASAKEKRSTALPSLSSVSIWVHHDRISSNFFGFIGSHQTATTIVGPFQAQPLVDTGYSPVQS